jgi:ABC-2 type transport system permease protein
MRPGFWSATSSILRHELRLLFLSTTAWVFLAAFLLLAGLFFVLGIGATGEASLRAAVPNWAVTLLFCIPLVTMRQLAEETHSGTLELLWTAPVPLGSLILGKWLATSVLCAVLLALTAPMVGVLWLYGDPDLGVLGTTYLGLFLCCLGFSAAGLFASSLTRDPTIAGIGGVLLLVPFWVAGPARDLAPETVQPWLERVSLIDHLRSFATGVLDSGDVVWFVAFITLFLFATWRSLEARRWA